jgi:hypothetical protein
MKLSLTLNVKRKMTFFIFATADVFTWNHYTPMSEQLRTYAWMEWAFTAIYAVRWILLPVLLSPPGCTFLIEDFRFFIKTYLIN